MDPNEKKLKRVSAKRVFTRKRNACIHSIDDDMDVGIVNVRLAAVEKAWSMAQNAHEEFMTALGFPENSAELDEWIQN